MKTLRESVRHSVLPYIRFSAGDSAWYSVVDSIGSPVWNSVRVSVRDLVAKNIKRK